MKIVKGPGSRLSFVEDAKDGDGDEARRDAAHLEDFDQPSEEEVAPGVEASESSPTAGRKQPVVIANPKATDVSYHSVQLSDLLIEPVGDGYSVADKHGRFPKAEASKRFWVGLTRKTEVRTDFFKLFSPAEVLQRVIAKDGDPTLVLAQDSGFILAPFLPGDPMIRLDEALPVMEGFSPTDITYHNGEVRAIFVPTRSGGNTEIVGEVFQRKFIVNIPIDGLSQPSISPLLIRDICSNILVAAAPDFVLPIIIGKKDAGFTVERAIHIYDADKFVPKVAKKLEQSRHCRASVAEVQQLVRLFSKSKIHHTLSVQLVEQVWKKAGPLAYHKYLENQGKNPKMLRRTESALSRYDLINMVTEARTHFVLREDVRRQYDAFIGTMLERDPDIEKEKNANNLDSLSSPARFFQITA